MGTIASDLTGCSKTCKWYGKPIPPHMPTPTCRLFQKYTETKNPVTKASYRDIINKRLQCSDRLENDK